QQRRSFVASAQSVVAPTQVSNISMATSVQPRTVLIRAPNWVGDAVMAVPALRELRRIFISSEITLVSQPWVIGLYEHEELADALISVSAGKGLAGSAIGFLRDAQSLRRKQFELAVLLQNAFGAALLARAAGAKTIAGYPTDRRRALLTLSVPFE